MWFHLTLFLNWKASGIGMLARAVEFTTEPCNVLVEVWILSTAIQRDCDAATARFFACTVPEQQFLSGACIADHFSF